ncbi:MAG: TOBE domain-containing protein, partial [Geminicoccaceae bacterium]|nr:TOBE domain-containing protein [Geminicoccaceae bacterium]
AYPLYGEGLGAAQIRAKVEQVARVLQLESIMGRKPGELAEGEKQRVAVGRSIIREPNCFLFDEPLSRLDVQLREEMRGEIKEVLQGLRRATVIVTHDQLEALTMADRIAVMRAGVIEQVATPHDIFQKPENLFVAGFIGTPAMNLIPAELTAFDAGNIARFAVEGGQTLAVEVDPAVARLRSGAKVTLGVRPRNLEVVHEDVPDGLSSVIDIIEPMGAETLAHLNDGRHDIRVVTDWRTPLEERDRVHVRFLPGSVHVFDADEKVVRA